MTDPALLRLFRMQASRLWQDFLPAWGGWLSTQDAAALLRLRHLVHTLKGSALGLDQRALADACHALESAWEAVPAEAPALMAWGRLRPLWQRHVEAGVGAGLATAAELEQAVAAFFRRTAAQLGLAAELHCHFAPAWIAEQALLWDVLPHLLRNALVHGEEAPDVRRAAGKPTALRVWVRGLAGPGRLRLLVADDGSGRRRDTSGAPDLWGGRGQGVAAVRAALVGRGCLQWRARVGRGGVARLSIFSF